MMFWIYYRSAIEAVLEVHNVFVLLKVVHMFSPKQTRSIQWNHLGFAKYPCACQVCSKKKTAKIWHAFKSQKCRRCHMMKHQAWATSCDYWASNVLPHQADRGSVSKNLRTLCGGPNPPHGPHVDGLVPVQHHCLVPVLHHCGQLSLLSHHVLLLWRLQKAGFYWRWSCFQKSWGIPNVFPTHFCSLIK